MRPIGHSIQQRSAGTGHRAGRYAGNAFPQEADRNAADPHHCLQANGPGPTQARPIPGKKTILASPLSAKMADESLVILYQSFPAPQIAFPDEMALAAQMIQKGG